MCWRASASGEAPVTTEIFVGLLAAVGLLAYLIVALLRPERF
jgi:K+-transporting ATPase KdpF subunit